MNQKEMETKLEALETAHNELKATFEAFQENMVNQFLELMENGKNGTTNRAPRARDEVKSTRKMTEEDAVILFTDPEISEMSTKDAAIALGLSYGQVYSALGGYTFKHVKEKIEKEAKAQRLKESLLMKGGWPKETQPEASKESTDEALSA